MHRLLASIPSPRCFASLQVEGAIAALGLVAVEGDWAGLFDLVTAPSWRNRGLGRRLVRHLLGWAATKGARSAYLQVQQDNAPALHLYASLGFQQAYVYWYRVRG
jgi:ribosomal protein S18 acetylase RimI-like enzyme